MTATNQIRISRIDLRDASTEVREASWLTAEKVSRLTMREIEIVKCLLNGKTAKETGAQLFISPRTVERHLENIKLKLGCQNKYQLASKVLSGVLSL